MTSKKSSSQLNDAYDAESFREAGHHIVDILTDYLKQSTGGDLEAVLPNITPDEMLAKWDAAIPRKPSGDFAGLVQNVIEDSIHLHHPKYIGHQVTAPLPIASLCNLVSSLLNNATAIYEMGPVNTAMENRVIQWMAKLIGYDENAGGILTSGGTLGNLTALLAARQVKADYDIWAHGVDKSKQLTILVSEQSHYSIVRAVGVMGLGEDAVVPVPVDTNYHMDIDALHELYHGCVSADRRIIAVVANGCSTATGSYDDLERIADFCEKYMVWFHLDGAHGASTMLSPEYRHYLKGINRVDSIVWDAHKMLLMPTLITAVIFKDNAQSYRSFSQKASYLFEKESREEWYNYAHRTMECSKHMMGIKFYIPLMVYGTDFFADYVTSRIDLAGEFAAFIDTADDFECAIKPECNIVCFRYTPTNESDLDELQKSIRRKILEHEKFYITQTQLKDGFYLRCTIINPLTTIDDLRELLEEIRAVYKKI